MSFTEPEPDELDGFTRRTLPLPREDDGELCATLVTLAEPQAPPDAPCVLWLHGFVDYFFHSHVAHAFDRAGLRFFALDLRRYGRSLRPANRPCYATRADEYFLEISAALEELSQGRQVGLFAHSTGGLIAAVYAARGPRADLVSRLVLNSPFLKFPTSFVEEVKLRVATLLAPVAPRLSVPQELSPAYGMTLHASQQGEWHYDLAKKPLRGFPFFVGWARMVTLAQTEVRRGLGARQPILVLHSERSARCGSLPRPEDFSQDTILDVADIASLAPRLGPRVTIGAIAGGLHDLTLSSLEVRNQVIERAIAFLDPRTGGTGSLTPSRDFSP